MKKILAFVLSAALALCLLPGGTLAEAATNETEEAGWYLTDYQLVFENLMGPTGYFFDGKTHNDNYYFYDADGTELKSGDRNTEGTIVMKMARIGQDGDTLVGYEQQISWDAPDEFIKAGKSYAWDGFSNTGIRKLGSESWSYEDFSVGFWGRGVGTGYRHPFVSGDNSQSYGIVEDATLVCEKIPMGMPGEKAYLVIDFNDADGEYYTAHAVYTYTFMDAGAKIGKKTYTTSSDVISKAGWYLTGYTFQANKESLAYGSDKKAHYNALGTYSSNDSKLENIIYVDEERFSDDGARIVAGTRYQIKWDTPQSYCAPNQALQVKNLTNTLSMSNSWGAGSVWIYTKDASSSRSYFRNSNGEYSIAETAPVTVTCEKPMPSGKKGDKIEVIVSLAAGEGVYTYSWLDKTKAATPTLKASKATLTLSGTNKKTSYTIASKNSSGYKVTYKTSNKKVATVSTKGKITAKKAGKATITVTFKKDKTTIKRTFKLTVKK